MIQTRTYAERQRVPRAAPMPPLPEHGFQFHLREAAPEGEQGVTADGFAGVRDYLAPTAPIHSCRGTVRGVKDRVRAGIATFLQDNNTAKVRTTDDSYAKVRRMPPLRLEGHRLFLSICNR